MVWENVKLKPMGNRTEIFLRLGATVIAVDAQQSWINYCRMRPSRWFGFASRMMLKWLESFAAADRGSDKVLCFGYHVLSRKRW